MALKSYEQNNNNTAVAVADKSRRKLIVMFWTLLSLIGVMLVLPSLGFAEQSGENLYAVNYKEQNPYQLKSREANPDTKMYVSNHKTEDNITMLEKGYDMMGTAGFTGVDVAPEFALTHGKAIKADTVLVYTKYSSAKAKAYRKAILKKQAEKDGVAFDETLVDEETLYDYYASYWAKVPMPTFGVHIIKLTSVMQDPETDEVKRTAVKGLKILAVINDSAANKAGVLKSDSLLKIGAVDMNEPEDLFSAVKRYKGQTVPVVVLRDKQEVTMQVALVRK
jgi:hypothetical protein